MYPTQKAPYYGTFVRSTEQAWRAVLGSDNVALVAMREKPVGMLAKIFLYTDLMVRCILSLVKKPHGTLLEVHYPVYFLPVLLLLKVFRKKFAVVLRFHGSDLKKIKSSRFFSYLFNKVKKEVTLYAVPSDYYVRKLTEELDVPSRQVVKVYPDCVGGSSFGSDASESKTYDVHESYSIGYVSRLEKEKNCEELIKAFAKLGQRHASLLIVGAGSQRCHLEALVDRLGIKHQIVFRGALPREELPEVMASLDIFVFPSLSETESFGLVGLEALSCGTPVIANGVLQGAKEYLVHGENGFFYHEGVSGLTEALQHYHDLPADKKKAMSINALQVRDKFSYENVFIKGAETVLVKCQHTFELES